MKNLISVFQSRALWTVVLGVIVAGVVLNVTRPLVPEMWRKYLP